LPAPARRVARLGRRAVRLRHLPFETAMSGAAYNGVAAWLESAAPGRDAQIA